jgi:uncharacterized protein YqgV (UPF0045/DUF77 family)
MVTAQVSVYPLGRDDIGPIIDRIIAVLQASGLVIETNTMSTILAGEHDAVFSALRDASASAMTGGSAVMSVTLSNACPLPDQSA